MKNRTLAEDYIIRAAKRLSAVDALFVEAAWADVVRESQEVVELALKGLLRKCRIEAPRVHDVSDALLAQKELLPPKILTALDEIVDISRRLRRDRELAFYGSEDLTPTLFYKQPDAEKARAEARRVVELVTGGLAK